MEMSHFAVFIFSSSYRAHHCIIVFALVFLSAGAAAAAALPLLLQLLLRLLRLGRWLTRSVWENSGIGFGFWVVVFFSLSRPNRQKNSCLKILHWREGEGKKLTSLLRVHPEGSSKTLFQKRNASTSAAFDVGRR